MPSITKKFTRAMYNAYFRIYNKKFPGKRKARRKVFVELRAGRLIKKPCQVCGEKKVEAHHKDYRKYLHVTWLCKKHHTDVDCGRIVLSK